ncbi:hypothetical protein U8527_07025 [Kordia algicida OT-1]|uniref:Uncharacterized protein n=1 Tax=Kordia algicida OT-1 TaxID=391587 RepID=A9E9Q4_9FLAO|nr:hypothetical protein [Kordia algicida]EDP94694.1 hypothetical protein KAOT1_00420 [Kordia algicida OT-1]
MNIIHFSTVFKRLDQFVKHHNSNSDKLSNHLRQPIVATAKEIIKIYGLSLLKAHKIKPLEVDNIPPLETNSEQLAKMAHVSTRTIRRHIQRLLDAKVLTEKVYKGRKANYQLRFNSNILLISGLKPVNKDEFLEDDKKKKTTDNQFFKNSLRTTCPQSDSSNNSYINNIIIAVDNKIKRSSLALTSHYFSGNKTGNKFTGYVEKEGAKRSNEPPLKGTPGAQKNVPKDDKISKKYSSNVSDLQNSVVEKEGQSKQVIKQAKDTASMPETCCFSSLNLYVDSLWNLSKETIYKNTFLTKNQQLRAKELLRDWYAPVSERNLAKVHNIYVQRIELVRKYLAKDSKNRYVQLPDRYFDVTNKYGFTGTKAWYEIHMKAKRKTRDKLMLHAQIRRFINNEEKDTSKQLSRLQLFKDCEKRIESLNSPELMDQFYATILNKTSFNHSQ